MRFDRTFVLRRLIPQLRSPARDPTANAVRMKAAADQLEAALRECEPYAYVGYSVNGTPIMIMVDDATPVLSEEVASIISAGGHVERMPLSRAIACAEKLYKPPEQQG